MKSKPTLSEGMGDAADDDLLLYMAAGDDSERTAAFAEFYYRYRQYLHDVCLRWCRTHGRPEHEAEDFVHDVIVRVSQKADTYQATGADDPVVESYNVKAWLGRIATHYIADCRRNQISVDAGPDETADQRSGPSEVHHEDPPSAEVQWVREAIAELPEEDQEILRAYMGEKSVGKSNARGQTGVTQRVADEYSTTQAAIRKRVQRAKERIKRYVENKQKEPNPAMKTDGGALWVKIPVLRLTTTRC